MVAVLLYKRNKSLNTQMGEQLGQESPELFKKMQQNIENADKKKKGDLKDEIDVVISDVDVGENDMYANGNRPSNNDVSNINDRNDSQHIFTNQSNMKFRDNSDMNLNKFNDSGHQAFSQRSAKIFPESNFTKNALRQKGQNDQPEPMQIQSKTDRANLWKF